MKKTLVYLFVMLTMQFCFAQNVEPKEYVKAMRYGADAMVTLNVIDVYGHPVTNAEVSIFFEMDSGSTPGKKITKQTNDSGSITAKGKTNYRIFFNVSKPNYYNSSTQYCAATRDPKRLKDGRWLPWNPTIKVLLRDVRNPIPMYVTTIRKGSLPENTSLGFDCKHKDFIPPHGNGENADFFIKFTPIIESSFDGACKIVFSPCEEGGGFIKKRKIQNSIYCSEYSAPNTGYKTFSICKTKQHLGYLPNPDTLTKDEYLIFKSRITKDLNGRIVSANYGKIYGEINYDFSKNKGTGFIEFTYYFNPTVNDQNLEFSADYKNNLFKDDEWEFNGPILIP